MPAELRKLHKRLNSDVGLYKLHIRHYHMSLRQFRARTSELALPEEIYQRCEKVVKTCKLCCEAAPVHPRSKVAGIRARNSGDVIFVDHADITYGDRKFIVLLIFDGATNLLSGFPQQDNQAVTTMECMR